MTNNSPAAPLHLPAEWDSRVNSVLLAYPASHTDWNYMLPEAKACFDNIIRAIIEDAGLNVLLVANPAELDDAAQELKDTTRKITVADIAYNDTWARDFGMISVTDSAGSVKYLDFKFNGWGLKFASDHDNLICRNLAKNGFLPQNRPLMNCQRFVMEGGSVETDGEGTLLTTSQCLLSPNRNAELTRSQIETILTDKLGTDRILWLEHGHLEGDDTDSHIDTLARFLDPETIAYVKCYRHDDAHKQDLDLMEEQLTTFRTRQGSPYRLVPLPLPEPIFDEDGQRLPATYANFLVTPRAILVPTYSQPEIDSIALETIRAHSGGRKVVGIDCSALIRQHGSLHCVTMQMI